MSFFDQEDEGDAQFSRGFRWGMVVGAVIVVLATMCAVMLRWWTS